MTVDELISSWWNKPGGQEHANFHPFIADVCELLGVDRPGAAEKGKLGTYEYEASVPGGSFRSVKGTGAIDLYKRGQFIMEAKQSYIKPEQAGFDLGDADTRSRAPSGARYDKLMQDAWLQARNYARNLPSGEPVAPFAIVCDVGRAFELYVDPAGNGRDYEFFPDRQSYRIELPDLASDAEVARTGKTALELLRAIWTAPQSIDPRFQAAEVTRKVAANLAEVSKYLEEGIKAKGLEPAARALEIEETSLFLMRVLFCMFAEDIGLLPPRSFQEFLKEAEGNDSYFANGLRDLFEKMNNPDAGSRFSMALKTQVRYFNGGLFEDSKTYPLGGFLVHSLYEAARQNWRRVEPAIFGTLLEQALEPGERAKLGAHYTPRPYVETLVRATIMDVLEPEWEAIEALPPEDILPAAQAFHDKLAATRVLDPACGTGNFLYVAMELLQSLESKVIERIQTLGGEAQPRIGPQQFYGLELNPRAAKIAELVLWIGWLRNRLKDDPDAVPEPVLQRSANLNMGRHGKFDALLRLDDTGEPDYEKPLMAAWPEVEFIVGNPPFIGKGSTNSITQTFNRRVIEDYLADERHPISLMFAVADHPWTKATRDAAAVRIAMTVAECGSKEGTLHKIVDESGLETDTPKLKTIENFGRINPDLSVGADVTGVVPLKANAGLSFNGMMLAGQGFKISRSLADGLVGSDGTQSLGVIRPYRGGSELLQSSSDGFVIDFAGLNEAQARQRFPASYQYLFAAVKPERDKNKDKGFREKWWLFGRVRPDIRAMNEGQSRYLATTETSKHRIFQFLSTEIIPDHMIIAIGSEDGFHLGVLQSRVHLEWCLRTGGWLGVGNDNRYNKSKVFDPFPFPDPTEPHRATIAELAEELDATRKAAIAETDKLTMTELYNLREKLRSGEPLSDKDQRRATAARAGIVDRIHQQLDQAVADAYGWGEEWAAGELGPSEIVARLVALNHERAAEEAEGTIRWLRPDYQIPRFGAKKVDGG